MVYLHYPYANIYPSRKRPKYKGLIRLQYEKLKYEDKE